MLNCLDTQGHSLKVKAFVQAVLPRCSDFSGPGCPPAPARRKR